MEIRLESWSENGLFRHSQTPLVRVCKTLSVDARLRSYVANIRRYITRLSRRMELRGLDFRKICGDHNTRLQPCRGALLFVMCLGDDPRQLEFVQSCDHFFLGHTEMTKLVEGHVFRMSRIVYDETRNSTMPGAANVVTCLAFDTNGKQRG